MLIEVLLLLVFSILAITYVNIKNRHKYWLKKKVPFIKPKHLFFGNTTELLRKGVPLVKYHETIYNELAPHKYGGYFHFIKPVFVIRDPDLIKTILIKDFPYFTDRGSMFTDEKEPLTLNLFNLGGARWKNLRIKVSPAFSSGKIKIMFHLMKECAAELVNVTEEMLKNDNDIEVKELMSR